MLFSTQFGMVEELKDWRWSSYTAVIGLEASAVWLDTDLLLRQFAKSRKTAIQRYHQYLLEGKSLTSPLKDVRHQLFLGDDSFVNKYHEEKTPDELREVSMAHKRSLAQPLSEYQKLYGERNEAMARAYLSGAYTMIEIGEHFGVHYMTVSRAVRKFEAENN